MAQTAVQQQQMEQKSAASSRQRRFLLLAGVLLLLCCLDFTVTNISLPTSGSSNTHSSDNVRHGEERSTNEGATNNTTRTKRKISMIVELEGEMANHLSLVAHAYAIKRSIEKHLMASTRRAVEIQLIGQHQDQPNWIGVRDNLQMCFSHFFASFDFEGGGWDKKQFAKRSAQQKAWLQRRGIRTSTGLLYVDPRDCRDRNQCWRPAADHLIALLGEQESNPAHESIQEDDAPSDVATTLSLPFLTSTSLSSRNDLIEEYYDELRALFQFDDERCCEALPADDEVFCVL